MKIALVGFGLSSLFFVFFVLRFFFLINNARFSRLALVGPEKSKAFRSFVGLIISGVLVIASGVSLMILV